MLNGGLGRKKSSLKSYSKLFFIEVIESIILAIYTVLLLNYIL